MALLSAGMLLGVSRAEAQHNYVKVHPTSRVVKRPPAPSPRHVWVGSEWAWSSGAYVETPGHWDLPPDGRRTWVAGHWTREARGSYWVAGHWR
jgi:WXXGXW repeat (2 copies)